ncbi:hypothetical protein [Burkholderia cenocepacia]|uniref:hypothetical protein n=1 Tax=Burkholderia cenocepacia TaxID=95486 RepID=UPI00076C6F83|nr:hypothetical protein [Burkholderia cenocepacia]KWU17761.1 hypothetical protein AS149_13660 [Burkholderia cenocepacia]
MWDDDARAKLARETLRVTEQTGASLLQALKMAQPRVLKPEQIRQVTAMQAVPWLKKAVDDARKQQLAERVRQEEEAERERQVEAQKQEMAAQAAERARQDIPTGALLSMLEGRAQVWATGMLKEVLLSVMRDPEIIEAASALFRTAAPATAPIETAWATVHPSVHSEANAAPENAGLSSGMKAAQRLAKVLVLGLLPGQARTIEREFKDKFRFEFMEAECSHHELRQNAQGAQFIFAMTGFINHSDEKQITSTAKERYMRVEGGLTRLRDALRETHQTSRLPLRAFRHGAMATH